MKTGNNQGYVKLFRKIIDWEWFDKPYTRLVFEYFLIKANFEDKVWRGIEIKRGQLVTSLRKIAKDNGISLQHTRTAISNIVSTHEITLKSTHNYTIITIVNYDNYQANEEKTTHQLTHNSTNSQHSSNTLPNNNIRIKEYKNNKKESNKEQLLSLLLDSEFYRSRDNLKQKIEEWLNYKNERKEYYKETGFKSLLRQIEKNIETYSEESIINLIDECMANNWKGIIFDKLKDNKKEKSKEKKDPYAGVKRS